MGRRSSLSGEVRVAGVSFGDQLRDVRNDALTANFGPRIQLVIFRHEWRRLQPVGGGGSAETLAATKTHRLKPSPLRLAILSAICEGWISCSREIASEE